MDRAKPRSQRSAAKRPSYCASRRFQQVRAPMSRAFCRTPRHGYPWTTITDVRTDRFLGSSSDNQVQTETVNGITCVGPRNCLRRLLASPQRARPPHLAAKLNATPIDHASPPSDGARCPSVWFDSLLIAGFPNVSTRKPFGTVCASVAWADSSDGVGHNKEGPERTPTESIRRKRKHNA
jgi:hypothetical protein